MPMTERLFEGVVENVDANRQKWLDGLAVPSHLLMLDHPLRDDLIHGGFGEGGRNRLAASIALPVIGQRVGVRAPRLR